MKWVLAGEVIDKVSGKLKFGESISLKQNFPNMNYIGNEIDNLIHINDIKHYEITAYLKR